MSKFVIDSNILFGAIISSREIYFEIIKKFDLYTPDFALKEIEKYEELILRKTKLELDIPLVTNDKKLYKELRKKGFSNIFLFEDFLDNFLH